MSERTKLWRNEKTKNKFKLRLDNLGLVNEESKFYCYKQQGKPCSCFMCSPKEPKKKFKQKYKPNYDLDDD